MKNAASILALVSVLALVLTGCSANRNGDRDVVVTRNSGLATGQTFPNGAVVLADELYFLVNEVEQNTTDLNGDGDVADNVVHRLDPTTQTVTNLGVAATMNVAANASFVAWAVPEASQGPMDFNGDGDTADHVLAVYDPSLPVGPGNPMITSTVVAANSRIIGSGNFFAFVTLESDLPASTDLNGDGDFLDAVPRILDATTLGVFNTMLALDTDGIFYDFLQDTLVFIVDEAEQGGMDLNGNMTGSDTVLFGADAGTNMTFPIGPAGVPRQVTPGSFAIVGTVADPIVIYAIDESAEGVSLNTSGLVNDTDTADQICGIYRLATMTETIPSGGLAIQSGRFSGSATRATISVVEADNGPNGTDFNNDGDASDIVPFWIDLTDLTTANNVGIAQDTDAASVLPVVCGNFFVMLADEASQGANGTNYNARYNDDDTQDTVGFFVDVTAPGIQAVNLEVAANQAICSRTTGSFVLLVADEAANGSSDLNANASTSDLTPAYFPVSGMTISTNPRFYRLDGNTIVQECPTTVRLIAFVDESSDPFFTDRNTDGDSDDFVCFTYLISKATGAFLGEGVCGTVDPNVAENAFPMLVGDVAVAFPTNEDSIGLGMNLNGQAGDQDAFDLILTYSLLTCP